MGIDFSPVTAIETIGYSNCHSNVFVTPPSFTTVNSMIESQFPDGGGGITPLTDMKGMTFISFRVSAIKMSI